ncbi:MAG TPA: hypothetical protein DCY42_00835 [Chloroflexi bacterium]|nr:hypothetical protein [Chloroflexota bacterium]
MTNDYLFLQFQSTWTHLRQNQSLEQLALMSIGLRIQPPARVKTSFKTVFSFLGIKNDQSVPSSMV